MVTHCWRGRKTLPKQSSMVTHPSINRARNSIKRERRAADTCNKTVQIKYDQQISHQSVWRLYFTLKKLEIWGRARPAPKVQLEIQIMGLVGRVKFEGTAPPRGQNIVSRKSPLGWVNMRVYNFVVSRPKFTKFFSSNRGWNVVDQVLFRFSICWSVAEIFAIKVESC